MPRARRPVRPARCIVVRELRPTVANGSAARESFPGRLCTSVLDCWRSNITFAIEISTVFAIAYSNQLLCFRGNACSIRRIKCSGQKPCSQCQRSTRDCDYPKDADKVSLPRAEFEALQARCEYLECRLATEPPVLSVPRTKPWTRPAGLGTFGDRSANEAVTNEAVTNEAITPQEGRLLQDPDGTARYLGPSSGAHFLNHVKEFLATILPLTNNHAVEGSQSGQDFLESIGRYQTSDSRTMQLPNVDPMWLPSRTAMTIMLTEFRFFMEDGNGDFASGGIFYWGDLSLDHQSLHNVPALLSSGQLALVQILLAISARLGSAGHEENEEYNEAFFSRARIIFGDPLDISGYKSRDISVMLLMASYLIEANRRDAAYVTVSVALHLAIMDGAHSCNQDEGFTRTFWTLYILDCWLSSLLGRPPGIADSAIRQPLPEQVL